VHKLREKAGLLAENDEDLLIFAVLGEVGRKFLLEKYVRRIGLDTGFVEEIDEAVYPI